MSTVSSISIPRPWDFHVHLRKGEMLRNVLPYTAKYFAGGLVMPNTDPLILTVQDALAYQAEIKAVAPDFTPLMTIKLTPQTTPEMIWEAKHAGVVAAKYYPSGVTTNSHDGFSLASQAFHLFEAMEECDMALCLHGEEPGQPEEFAEDFFIKNLFEISQQFPELRIVFEHVSTLNAVNVIKCLPNVVATITAHHLLLAYADVFVDSRIVNPHHYCKPVVKTEQDRGALIEAATSGDPKFFLGTDSAPHPREAKNRQRPAAGIFSAPHALLVLAQVFEERRKLGKLQDFTSTFGCRFYGVKSSLETLTLVPYPWKTPAEYNGIVPLCGGRILYWNYSSPPRAQDGRSRTYSV